MDVINQYLLYKFARMAATSRGDKTVGMFFLAFCEAVVEPFNVSFYDMAIHKNECAQRLVLGGSTHSPCSSKIV